MPSKAPAGDAPRRVKPVGRAARYAAAKKNNNDLLADCERLLLREAEQPQIQNGGERRNDVIHPSEMAKSDWCPRATFLRIRASRVGLIPTVEPHHFQLENIFEEGHEYHRKWQARFRRMGRLKGRWFCEACAHRWKGVSPKDCPECGAPEGAITYHEVGLADPDWLIFGSADGEVLAAKEDEDDVLIEIKSVGEGTVRMEMPTALSQHTYTVTEPRWGKELKVLDTRGVWKDITKPFGPHLRQGLIYLRMRNDPKVNRICFLYEFKPTSMVKAFYVTRDDEAVDELWESCKDIVYALDKGGRPPKCVNRRESCAECKVYEELESEHDHSPSSRRATEGEPRRRGRAGEAAPTAAGETEGRHPRPDQRSDRPRGRRADRPAGEADEVGGLLRRAARPRRG